MNSIERQKIEEKKMGLMHGILSFGRNSVFVPYTKQHHVTTHSLFSALSVFVQLNHRLVFSIPSQMNRFCNYEAIQNS